MCLDMDEFYLAGEPGTNSEASLILRLKLNTDYISAYNTFENQKNVDFDGTYDETYENIYQDMEDQYKNDEEATQIHVTFS